MTDLVELGKKLSYILRHDFDAFNAGLIDKNGWLEVVHLNKQGYTNEILDKIVETNNKQRFEYNEDKTKIRARQGHSIPVDVELKEMTPPELLYHGTATRFLDSIRKDGILPQSRLYVHLSNSCYAAKNVGKRHGQPCAITIETKKMVEDGIKFYWAHNGVWLVEKVDPKYFGLIIEFID